VEYDRGSANRNVPPVGSLSGGRGRCGRTLEATSPCRHDRQSAPGTSTDPAPGTQKSHCPRQIRSIWLDVGGQAVSEG
jgi:hypothetical protein